MLITKIGNVKFKFDSLSMGRTYFNDVGHDVVLSKEFSPEVLFPALVKALFPGHKVEN